jgi:NADH-quinone oxidoreductase subunit M
VQRIGWVDSLGISYHVGADGVNIGLILMGAIVAFAAACASWEIQERQKEFYVLLLTMTGGILGAFASLDLFFFFFFHELALIPTFIMIGIWGRGADKNYATFQMTIYLSLGALIALVGLIALYLQAGGRTFDIPELTQQLAANPLSTQAQHFIFPFLLFGFGILVSLFPFHTWAPLGYGAAPTPTAMLHAGVLKKFGLYGLIRVALPLLPDAARSWMQLLAILCLGNILYVGLVALRQKDLNLLIGNSSVAHMGFAFLGIASLTVIGITGTVVIMVAHGLLAALTFGLAGYLYQHTRTFTMAEMGGLLRPLPFLGTVFVMAAFAGCGLPGFANFVGEMAVFFGAWKPMPVVTILAVWGALVIGAVYMLRAVRAIWHGPVATRWDQLADDPGPWRKLPFVLLVLTLLAFGMVPRFLTDRVRPAVEAIVKMTNPADASTLPLKTAQAAARLRR